MKRPPGLVDRAGWGLGGLSPQDHGDHEHGHRAEDQRQPEVAEDLKAQGGDRDAGEDMDVGREFHGRVSTGTSVRG